MKNISEELKTHLGEEVTTLASCWKVTRRDGTVLGFTDHDSDFTYDEVLYQAASGFTPTAVESSSALSVDNMDIEGMLDASVITEADVLAGIYDFAQVELFLLNYMDLSMGHMTLRTGWLGEVQLKGKQFVAELRGLSQKLSTRIGEHFTPGCRADLGDARCKVNLASYTVTGTATLGESRHEFADSTRSEESGYFSTGKVTFTSGDNSGLSMEVKEFSNGQFKLVLPMPYRIEPGDGYSAIAGCDKRFETCAARYNNAANFRGEPHVPGTDWLTQTASTRNTN